MTKDLALQIARRVMDRVERDGCLCLDSIAEEIAFATIVAAPAFTVINDGIECVNPLAGFPDMTSAELMHPLNNLIDRIERERFEVEARKPDLVKCGC